MKHIAQYLLWTKHRGITFGVLKDMFKEFIINGIFEAWTDADHAGEKDKARSRSGILVKMYGDTVDAISKPSYIFKYHSFFTQRNN